MKNTKKKGFTIVELVIVIAVIAILAAVLIPTFTNVVKKAKESSAMQAAKNAYTNFLTEEVYFNAAGDEFKLASDETHSVKTLAATVVGKINLSIESDGYYFYVTKGEFSTEAHTAHSSEASYMKVTVNAAGALVSSAS